MIARQFVGRHRAQPVERHLGLGRGFLGERIGEDQLLAGLRPKGVLGGRHLVEPVADARRIVDGAVAGDGPRRRRPDDDDARREVAAARSRFAWTCMPVLRDRKLHPDRVALVVLVLDLGLGQRGALDHAPHHRLGAAVELAGHGEFQELAGDARLGVEIHRRIGLFEIALDAQPLELLGLHLDPVRREVAAFLAELVDRHLVLVLALGAILLLDLPLDRQAVAVPAGHVVGVEAAHLERAVDDVLQDLVERMPDMDVAVGIGRAVMQHIARPACRTFAQPPVELHVLPALDEQRLLLGQAGAHREIRARQVQRLRIVEFFGGVGHCLASVGGPTRESRAAHLS